MRGRGDGRFQSRGGGRGRYGRGQGEPHKPISNGRKPEVGAYLDLPRGQAAVWSGAGPRTLELTLVGGWHKRRAREARVGEIDLC